jgi:hypothetical protein
VVTIHFTLTAAEAYAAQRRVTLRHRGIWAYVVLALAVAVLGAVASSEVLLASGIAAAGVYALMIWWWAPRRMWSRQALMRREQTITVSEDGIAFRYATASSSTQWDFWKRIRRLGACYVLQGSQRGYTLIPRRAFASDADEARFRELIAAHLGVALA